MQECDKKNWRYLVFTTRYRLFLSLNRMFESYWRYIWFEIKGQPLTVSEVQKCEQFCRRKDNENIKFSILIGAPKPLMLEEEDFSILGIREYTWQWPSQMYPSDTLLLAQGLTREEYYSRFLPAIWKVDGVDDKLLIRAIREARSARFEFGETPKGR